MYVCIYAYICIYVLRHSSTVFELVVSGTGLTHEVRVNPYFLFWARKVKRNRTVCLNPCFWVNPIGARANPEARSSKWVRVNP